MKQVKATEQHTADVSSKPQQQRCIVCTEQHEVGIHIWDQFICHKCEGEMIMTDVSDAKYPFFVKQLKKIWLKENAQ